MDIEPDGFYFVPDGDGGYEIQTFFYSEDSTISKVSAGATDLGHQYHIAFFYDDENGQPKFDETFDAIFTHPLTYVKTLLGSKYYGVIARKTENSAEWFQRFVNELIQKFEVIK